MQLYHAAYLSVLATLIPLALANFDVYADHYRDWSNTAPQTPGFRIFGRKPDDACKYVNDVRTFFLPPSPPPITPFLSFPLLSKPPTNLLPQKTYIRWPIRADASADKFGIRCEGPGCTYKTADPSAITSFEMHFSNKPAYHWTLYADNQGYKAPAAHPSGLWMMTNEVNTRAPGYCFPYPGDEYNCERSQPAGPGGAVFHVGSRGRRLFRCVTYNGDVRSDDINGQRLQDVDMYFPYPDDDKKKSAAEGGVVPDESQGMIGQ